MKKWKKYITPYRRYFILGPLCMIVEVIGEVLMPKFFARVINAANAGELTNAISLQSMGLMILTAVLMMAGGVGGAWFGSRAAVNFAADLREDLFRKIQTFSFTAIDRFQTGSLVTRLTNDVTQLQNLVNMALRMALRAPGMMIGALIMAIAMNPELSVVFAVSLPLLLCFVLLLIRIAYPRFQSMQQKVDRLNTTVQENVTNVRVVKSFVRESFEIERFAGVNADLKNTALSAFRVLMILMPGMTLFMNGTVVAVILVGGPIVLNGRMPVGDLSAFITYVSQILVSLMMVSMLFMISARAMASARRVREVLDETAGTETEGSRSELTVEQGAVEFRHVSFRYYKNREEKVLDDISLSIPAGSTVGIIGSTGCGKSTLVSLISRLYDADEGEVLVDGVNVREYSLKHLRDGVGMVLQKNTLFSGTIAENLRWGDPEASDELVQRMASYAQADKFVDTFPERYKKVVEQGGTNVSGGQKQRLCIARALLKKPRILILDDSTSAVDTATEAQIRRAFREELPGSTKLIIAQRIQSVMEADRIVVMNEGRITGVGTHEELMQSNEEYREIYESQMERREA